MHLPFTLRTPLKGLLLVIIFLPVSVDMSHAQSYQGLMSQPSGTWLADRLLQRQSVTIQRPYSFPIMRVARHQAVAPKLKMLTPMIQSLTPFDDDLQAQFCAERDDAKWITHFGMSFVTTLGMQYILETQFELSRRWAFVLSALSGLAVGFAQEYNDWNNTARNCFRSEDLWASSIGVLSGAVVIFTF